MVIWISFKKMLIVFIVLGPAELKFCKTVYSTFVMENKKFLRYWACKDEVIKKSFIFSYLFFLFTVSGFLTNMEKLIAKDRVLISLATELIRNS